MDPNFLAIMGALALLVRIGHTLHTMGAVRARSVAAVGARALIGTASIVLVTYATGHVLDAWARLDWDALSGPGHGSRALFRSGPAIGPAVFFQSPGAFLSILPIALLPGALLGGASAERARVRGLFLIVSLLTAVVLPALTATGWVLLAKFDHRDAVGGYVAGASLSAVTRVWPVAVAYLVAAAGGLTLARVIGARAGKYNRDGSANVIPAHNLPLMIAGDLLLIVGLPMLVAALAGEPAARVVHAILAGSASTLGAVITCSLRDRRVDVLAPWNAALAGLVAGSLVGGDVALVAIALGLAVGLMMPILSLKVDLRLRIDETASLCVPTLVGALAGLIGAALNGAFEGDATIGGVMLLVGVVFWAGVGAACVGVLATLAPALILRRAGWLRVDADSEVEGLDLAQHDINAYPDFQQTLIKSYHLRQ